MGDCVVAFSRAALPEKTRTEAAGYRRCTGDFRKHPASARVAAARSLYVRLREVSRRRSRRLQRAAGSGAGPQAPGRACRNLRFCDQWRGTGTVLRYALRKTSRRGSCAVTSHISTTSGRRHTCLSSATCVTVGGRRGNETGRMREERGGADWLDEQPRGREGAREVNQRSRTPSSGGASSSSF